MSNDVRELVNQVFKETLGKHIDIEDDMTIQEWGVDSLDMVELVMGIEEELDITIPEDEVENINTFGELVQVAENKVNEK